MRIRRNQGAIALALLLSSSALVLATPTEAPNDFCETAGSSFAADQVAQNEQATNLLANADQGIAWIKGLRGDNKINLVEFIGNMSQGNQDYLINVGMGIAPFAGPPLVLFALSLVFCPCFFIARCCMAKSCCKPKKALEEYGACSKFVPLVFYFLFSTASVGLALYGILSTGNVIAGAVGAFCTVRDTLASTGELIVDIQAPFSGMASAVTGMKDTAIHAFDTADNIHTVAPTLVTQFTAFGNRIGNVTFTGNVSSDYFNTTSVAVLDTAGVLDTTLDEALNLFDTARAQLVDGFGVVGEQLAMGSAMLDMLAANISSFIEGEGKVELDAIAVEVTGYLRYTEIGSYVFYSAVFIGFIAGVVAVFLYVTPFSCDDVLAKTFMSCSWACTYLFMVFLFLLSGILLPVSFVMSDTCEVISGAATSPSAINQFIADLGAAMSAQSPEDMPINRRLTESSDPDIIEILGGCLTEDAQPPGKILSDLFGLESQLDSDAIEGQLDQAGTNPFDPTDLFTFTNQIDTLTLSDMGVNATKIDDALNELNTLTSKTYTRPDCTVTESCNKACLATSTCASAADNPAVDATDLENVRSKVIDAITAIDEATVVLAWMKVDARAINTTVVDLYDILEQFSSNVALVKNPLGDLVSAVNSLTTAGDCTYIGSDLRLIISEICDGAVGGLGSMSISMFFIALFGIPMIILSVILQIRMFGMGSSKVAAMEFVTRDT